MTASDNTEGPRVAWRIRQMIIDSGLKLLTVIERGFVLSDVLLSVVYAV